MTQVKKYITSLERCVLKAPWSGSGRGIMYVSSKEWNDSAEGWVSRVLRVQGEIMVEPLCNKVCDFAMEFYADGMVVLVLLATLCLILTHMETTRGIFYYQMDR